MNIFFLDSSPVAAASALYARHKLKMLVESTQLLCNTVRHNCPQKFDSDIIYATTHDNHPCSLWARGSLSNFLWLYDHAHHLTIHYSCKYGKRHKCWDVLQYIKSLRMDFDKIELTEPPQCMHAKYKSSNPIVAYRSYYVEEKGHIFDTVWGDMYKWTFDWVNGAPTFPIGSAHHSMIIRGYEGLLPDLLPARHP